MVWVCCGSGLGPLQKHSHTYIRYIEGISSHSIAVNRHIGLLSLHSTSPPCDGLVPLSGYKSHHHDKVNWFLPQPARFFLRWTAADLLPTRTMSTTPQPGHPTPSNSRGVFSITLAMIWLAQFIVAARLAGDIRWSRRLGCFCVRVQPHMGRWIIQCQVMLYNQDPDRFGTYKHQSIR